MMQKEMATAEAVTNAYLSVSGAKVQKKSETAKSFDINLSEGMDEATAGSYKAVGQRLEGCMVTNVPDEQEPPALFTMNGVQIISKCALTLVTGQKKNGKSNISGLIKAAVIHPELSVLDGQFRCNVPQLRVVDINTEMPLKDQRRILRRAMKTAGFAYGEEWTHHDIFSYDISSVGGWEEKQIAVNILMAQYRPDILIIDGLADIIKSINDEVQAISIFDWGNALARGYECAVIAMLHQNHGSDKIGGWAGTQAGKKYSDCLSLKKSREGGYFTIAHEGRGESAPDLRFRINAPVGDQFGWWEAVDAATIDDLTDEDKAAVERESTVNAMPLPMSNTALLRWLMDAKRWTSKSPANKYLRRCKADGLLHTTRRGRESIWVAGSGDDAAEGEIAVN